MISIEHSFKLDIPIRNAYRYLADFESYPRFMESVRAVQPIDEVRFQWQTVSEDGERDWEIEITELSPEKCISWRNLSGPVSVGTLVFDPAAPDRTVVTAIITCHPDEDEAQSEDIRRSLSHRMLRDIASFKKFVESAEKRNVQSSVEDKTPDTPVSAQEEADASSPASRTGKIPASPGKRRASRNGTARTNKAQPESETTKARPQSVPGDSGNWAPPVEIAHGEKEVIVCAELPGVKREDIRIEIRGEKLTIEGERSLLRSMSEMEYRRSERPYGHFSRLILLPGGIDARAAAASLQDGVLEIRVPMASHARPDASSSAVSRQ